MGAARRESSPTPASGGSSCHPAARAEVATQGELFDAADGRPTVRSDGRAPTGEGVLPLGEAQAPTTPHCQPCPGARTGFVFICPGRFEAQRGYPCAAGTGANLARALAELHRRDPLRFPSPQRAAYVVTNAWATVEYPALTGRSVPTVDEVLQPDNLARLARELAGLRWVVACGTQAHAAVRALQASGHLGAAVACERHLSQRSINGIRDGADTAERIARWCDSVLQQLDAVAGSGAAAAREKIRADRAMAPKTMA